MILLVTRPGRSGSRSDLRSARTRGTRRSDQRSLELYADPSAQAWHIAHEGRGPRFPTRSRIIAYICAAEMLTDNSANGHTAGVVHKSTAQQGTYYGPRRSWHAIAAPRCATRRCLPPTRVHRKRCSCAVSASEECSDLTSWSPRVSPPSAPLRGAASLSRAVPMTRLRAATAKTQRLGRRDVPTTKPTDTTPIPLPYHTNHAPA